MMFTEEVEHECENQGMFGPVPVLMYEFENDLTESMSGGAAGYTLQAVGDVEVFDGALVCDGDGDYVYSSENLDFGFSGHSLEVLVSLDNLESQGGGTIALDGLYTTDGGYTHTKFDSIVYNEVDNNHKWISGSENFHRTDTSGSNTAETVDNSMVHLISTYDPDDGVVEIYRNGVLEQSFSPDTFLTDEDVSGYRMMFCQRHMDAGLNDFEGKIYMGAVYDYALTQEDVVQIFHSRVVEIDFNGEMLTVEAVGDSMTPGSELLMGQGLLSADHSWLATFRPDGWFMIYDMMNEEMVFESTNGRAAATCLYNEDGSLALYGTGDRTLYHSRTTDDNPMMLVMGINGLLQGFTEDNSVYYEQGAEDQEPSSTSEAMSVLGVNELKDVSSKWTLTVHGSTETFLLYFCALLVLVNVVCGSVYCYSKRTQMPYKVVSMDGTEAEITESELEDNEKFLE